MTLYIHPTEPRGFIEWDIPRLDDVEEIGLRFSHTDPGAELTDYDGVHSLPIQAIEMLREAGFVVSKEFE